MATGNMSDSTEALVDGSSCRCAFPIRWASTPRDSTGRIDDVTMGWKGKGLWSTYAGRAPYHIEGGKGTPARS